MLQQINMKIPNSPHQHSFYDLAQNEGAALRCPFAHHQDSPKENVDVVDVDVGVAQHQHDEAIDNNVNANEQRQGACNRHEHELPVYQQSCHHEEHMHDVMPPEHKALAAGYTGSTCPFLDHNSSLTGDEEAETQTKIEPREGAGISADRITSTPQQHANAHPQKTTIREQPASCIAHTTKTNVNSTKARQKMDTILSAQHQALHAIEQAKQQLVQAQTNLTLAQKQKESVDSILTSTTQDLTDSLLQEDSPWNSMYKQLMEFKRQYEHCDVKRHWSKEEKIKNPDLAMLGAWVGKTRQEGRRPLNDPHRLEPYKIVALQRLGFDWAPRDNAWMQNYEKIRDYIQQNPGKLPQRRKDPLGTWCNGQIVEYNKFISGDKKAYITQKKIDLLNAIGFVWDRASNTWSQRYENLKEFHAIHGHCRLPKNYKDQVLYRWVTKERIKYRNNSKKVKPCHTEEQNNLLDSIGFMDGNRIKARTCATSSGSKRKHEGDAKDEAVML